MASMGGRVQIAGLAAAVAKTRTVHVDEMRKLYGRLLGQRVEHQHVLPENEGSTQPIPMRSSHPVERTVPPQAV